MMELPENTLILATLLAIGLYFFMQGKPASQPVSSAVDADERQRRREHFAMAAEARARCETVNEKDGFANSTTGSEKEVSSVDAKTSRDNAVTRPPVLEQNHQKKVNKVQPGSDKPPAFKSSTGVSSTNKPVESSDYKKRVNTQTSTETSSSNGSPENDTPTNQQGADTSSTASQVEESTHSSDTRSNKSSNIMVAASDKSNEACTKSINSAKCITNEQSAMKSNKAAEAKMASIKSNSSDDESTSPITIHLLLTSASSTPKTSISISPSYNTLQLRQLASKATSVPLNELRLIYRGKVITDGVCISKYGLEDGSVLHLVGKPKVDAVDEIDESVAGVNAAIASNETDNDSIEDSDIHSNNESNQIIEDDDSSSDEEEDEELGRPPMHNAAAIGDILALRNAAIHNLPSLYEQDINGWTPLHEAARGGHPQVIEFLVSEAEQSGIAPNTVVNTVSNFGRGWSPLALAIQYHGTGHVVTNMLRQFGGEVVYPRH